MIVQKCDGCLCEVNDAEAQIVGRYDPCVYCAKCLATWRAAEAEDRAAHTTLVRAFEADRAQRRAAVKAAGLVRLPDEG